jgi:hypothetical protein
MLGSGKRFPTCREGTAKLLLTPSLELLELAVEEEEMEEERVLVEGISKL